MFIINSTKDAAESLSPGPGAIEPAFAQALVQPAAYNGTTMIKSPTSTANSIHMGQIVRQILRGTSVSTGIRYSNYDDYYKAWCYSDWQTVNDTNVKPITLPKELIDTYTITDYYAPDRDGYIVRFMGYVKLPKGNYRISISVDDSAIFRLAGNNNGINSWYEGVASGANSSYRTVIDGASLTGRYNGSIATDWYEFGIFYEEWYSAEYLKIMVTDISTGNSKHLYEYPLAYSDDQLLPGV